MVAVTASEFSHDMRASSLSPAMMIMSVFDQRAGDRNGKYSFLDNFSSDMDKLSKVGLMAFNEFDQSEWLVFPVLHKILGDGPGRTALTGYKSSSGESFKLCHGCDIGGRHLKDQFINTDAYKEYPRRNPQRDFSNASEIVFQNYVKENHLNVSAKMESYNHWRLGLSGHAKLRYAKC